MAFDPLPATAFLFIKHVEQAYSGLMQAADRATGEESGLGGKLLYAGELDDAGRAVVVAGNIAGAATLTATACPEAQKQAVRDGVVDFLVTSLDEALRIMKNEIRKQEAVAVCVAAAPEAVEQEMRERGVLPDMVTQGVADRLAGRAYMHKRILILNLPDLDEGVVVAWRVATMPAQWLPKLDAVVAGCLDAGQGAARRWLRLAPRYVGRLAQGVRLLRCDEALAASVLQGVREHVTSGEIAVPVEIQVSSRGESHLHLLSPRTLTAIPS